MTDKRKMFLQKGGLEQTSPVIEKDGKRYRQRKGELALCCSAELSKGSKSWLCRNFAINGGQFCLIHGGTPKPANTNSLVFTTGLKSSNSSRFRNIGKKMLQRIEELREDPELWSLKDDTAYITALLDLRAEAAAEGVNIDQYKKIQELYKECCKKKHQDDFWETFDEIGKVLENVMSEYDASKEVLELMERRTEIVETEQRLLHQKAYTLEVDQAYSMMMQMVNLVKTHVSNAEELASIKAGVGKLLATYKESFEDEIMDAEVIDGTEEPGEYEDNAQSSEEIHQTE